MDYQFPQQLFPSFYNNGPPSFSVSSSGEAGGWGCYDGVLPQVRTGSLSFLNLYLWVCFTPVKGHICKL